MREKSPFCVIADSGPTVVHNRIWLNSVKDAEAQGRRIQLDMIQKGLVPRELLIMCRVGTIEGVPQSTCEPQDKPSRWQCHAYRQQWKERTQGERGT